MGILGELGRRRGPHAFFKKNPSFSCCDLVAFFHGENFELNYFSRSVLKVRHATTQTKVRAPMDRTIQQQSIKSSQSRLFLWRCKHNNCSSCSSLFSVCYKCGNARLLIIGYINYMYIVQRFILY